VAYGVGRGFTDFDDYWGFHEIREYERTHLALYADQHVPATAQPKQPLPRRSRRTLKLVKK